MTGGGGDTSEVRFPPPLIFIGLLLAGLAADDVFGLNPATPGAVRGVGIGIALLGFGLIVSAVRQFRRAGNDPEPWKPDAAFVAQGLYRFSRNPMYLGMTLMLMGIALALDSLGALLLVPVALLLTDRFVIAREERHLARRFGTEYQEYCRHVRRWF